MDDRNMRVIVVRDVQRIVCLGGVVIGRIDRLRSVVVRIVECGFGAIVFGLVGRAVLRARRDVVRSARVFFEVVAIDGFAAFFLVIIGFGWGTSVEQQQACGGLFIIELRDAAVYARVRRWVDPPRRTV